MRELRIPKRSGAYRIVVCPDRKTKIALRSLLPKLQSVAILLDVHRVQHGFVPGRSPITNAKQHVGYQWSMCCDLADCFDHVTVGTVESAIGHVVGMAWLPLQCFHLGIARQGLPTSPTLCNIALAPMDSEIVGLLDSRGVYTRYADDLTISSNDSAVITEMLSAMPEIARRHGHEIAPHKTHTQCAVSGRRIITGVAVDHDVHPTREMKRRLRASQHQSKRSQANGLAEWCKLTPPNWPKQAVRLFSGNDDERQLALLVAAQNR